MVVMLSNNTPIVTYVNSFLHQPFEELGEGPCGTSVKKCVIVDVSHIIFWR